MDVQTGTIQDLFKKNKVINLLLHHRSVKFELTQFNIYIPSLMSFKPTSSKLSSTKAIQIFFQKSSPICCGNKKISSYCLYISQKFVLFSVGLSLKISLQRKFIPWKKRSINHSELQSYCNKEVNSKKRYQNRENNVKTDDKNQTNLISENFYSCGRK